MIYHHRNKFGGLSYCSRRDISSFFCHVTKQDHLIKESSDYNDGSSSRWVPTLTVLEVIIIVIVEI